MTLSAVCLCLKQMTRTRVFDLIPLLAEHHFSVPLKTFIMM